VNKKGFTRGMIKYRKLALSLLKTLEETEKTISA